MFSFFSFWFLDSLILLTPQNVDIQDFLILTPKKPITAVTERARIRIDVQPMLPKRFNSFDNSSDSIFPEGCVVAEISNNKKNTYMLTSSNRLSPSSDGSIGLMLLDSRTKCIIRLKNLEEMISCL